MIITIDAHSATPPYEQLRQQLMSMMLGGVLQAEDRIPPIRQLAKDLDLAAGTVNRAIRELEAEGWLETRGHRGTFVKKRSDLGSDSRESQLMVAALVFVQNARQLGASRTAAIEAVRDAFDGH